MRSLATSPLMNPRHLPPPRAGSATIIGVPAGGDSAGCKGGGKCMVWCQVSYGWSIHAALAATCAQVCAPSVNMVRLPTHAPLPPAPPAAPQALCCMSPGCVYASIKREEKTVDYIVYKEKADCEHRGSTGQGSQGRVTTPHRPPQPAGRLAGWLAASTALPPPVQFLGALGLDAPALTSVPCAIT